MSIKKFIFPSLAVCIALVLTPRIFNRATSAQAVPGDESYDEVDTYLEQQMRRLNIPGMALIIVEGDEIVHFQGFGKAHPDGEAPTPQTPFLIGSLTKSITATAVMQLVETGAIELDTPVQRYLPWFRVADSQASTQITVRHLLNQTSGIPQMPGMIGLADFEDYPDAVERGIRELATLELAHPVGSAFEYSNVNYNILGLIIETASGEIYADYIQNHIFDPLEMRHSFTSQATARENDLAVGHRYWFSFPIAEPDLPMPTRSLPSGQIIASAEDLGHYLIAHLNAGQYNNVQILSRASMEELHRPAAEAVEMGISMGYYSMGWFVEEHGAKTVLSHPGTVPDFFAYMALLPEQNKGMALLINANHVIMDKMPFTEMGQGIALQLAGETPPPNQFDWAPWMLRGLLLIPVLQIVEAVLTLRRLRRWRQKPDHPTGAKVWLLHVLLPLIPNLALIALPFSLIISGILGFTHLFMPDFAWISLISGGFALFWVSLRSWLIFMTLHRPRNLETATRKFNPVQSHTHQESA